MKDTECVPFLQWALPRLRMRWPGFRKVRGQVCKRISRRMRELGIDDVGDYRARLEAVPEEWRALDDACRITISRFYRDKRVFDQLAMDVLPVLADRAASRGDDRLRCLSVGCASGEEPYTLMLIWRRCLASRYPGLPMSIVGMDADLRMLERADRGEYSAGALRDLPMGWREGAFEQAGDSFRLRDDYRKGIEFAGCDIRHRLPEGPFDLVLCRNLVFTYFEESLQKAILPRLAARLHPGGALVLGIRESLPDCGSDFEPWDGVPAIYRRGSGGGSG